MPYSERETEEDSTLPILDADIERLLRVYLSSDLHKWKAAFGVEGESMRNKAKRLLTKEGRRGEGRDDTAKRLLGETQQVAPQPPQGKIRAALQAVKQGFTRQRKSQPQENWLAMEGASPAAYSQPPESTAEAISDVVAERLKQEMCDYITSVMSNGNLSAPRRHAVTAAPAQSTQHSSRLMEETKVQRSLVFGDLHCPYEDRAAWDLFLRFAEWFQPSRLIANGDLCDCYSVSSYNKSPQRKDRFQHEIDITKQRLREICDACPDAKKDYNEGNHEARLKAYLWRNPELASLDALAVPHLLSLDEMGFQYHGGADDLWLPPGDLLVTHGSVICKYSGYTAKAEMERHGCHGISGHTHRLNMFYRTIHGKPRVWAEGGHLSDVKQVEYTINPDWLLGFCVVYHIGSQFLIQAIPIVEIDGQKRIFFEGLLWTGN